jgi:hypothetical protein
MAEIPNGIIAAALICSLRCVENRPSLPTVKKSSSAARLIIKTYCVQINGTSIDSLAPAAVESCPSGVRNEMTAISIITAFYFYLLAPRCVYYCVKSVFGVYKTCTRERPICSDGFVTGGYCAPPRVCGFYFSIVAERRVIINTERATISHLWLNHACNLFWGVKTRWPCNTCAACHTEPNNVFYPSGCVLAA